MKIYVKFENEMLTAIYTQPSAHEVLTTVYFEGATIDFTKIEGYKLESTLEGNLYLVFDEKKYNDFVTKKQKEEALKQAETLRAELAQDLVLKTATDEQAYSMRVLYPEWSGNSVKYTKDQRLMYQNKFYKVLQDHVSQMDWPPSSEATTYGAAASLFVEIPNPAKAWPAFKKPAGAHDAYTKGSKVTFEGKHYISKIDANVYSPTEYSQGWELVA